MSFKDGNLHDRITQMEQEQNHLRVVAKFMLDCLKVCDGSNIEGKDKWPQTHSASWGYIVKELRKAGIEIEY